ncbi:MAG: hypothetical protein JO053_01515 [Acidobacteria bacterium]|nr:hypothetical protein [Acidobacteriota bacterium]
MPEFDSATRTKIASLRALRAAGTMIEVHELVKIAWTGNSSDDIYYSVQQTDEVASVAPPVSPIEVRLVPGGSPNWFLPIDVGGTIGDEEVDLTFGDLDGTIAQKILDNGEGQKTTLYLWFPQVSLLLPQWYGHLQPQDDGEPDTIKVKVAQGFRSSEMNVPSRAHYTQCQAIFGGLLPDQPTIDALKGCPYNKHIGGSVGNYRTGTTPWTFCDRKDLNSCTARGIDPLYHLSHLSAVATVVNPQHKGHDIIVTSTSNETNLKDPVRVVMGYRKIRGLNVLAWRRNINNKTPDHGWFHVLFEVSEGPNESYTAVKITVANQTQDANPQHYLYRLGTPGQSVVSDLTTHGYSSTGLIHYVFGWINPENLTGADASAEAIVGGLSNIRVYSDVNTYTGQTSQNRAWQIARILTDKRWGYGLDYDRLNIQSFIDAAAWCEDPVTFTDTFGTAWSHVRARSDVELSGRKVQTQVEDICRAGLLSRPFLFDGKFHIVPLKALTSDELAACPVFTDEGGNPNIVWEGDKGKEKTTLRIGPAKFGGELINRIESTFDDQANDYLETPAPTVEDIDAQLAAGRVFGDSSRKVNSKKYSLMGVTYQPQAVKVNWALLDRGEFDEGGLQNNCKAKFKIWFADALDLHPYKVIKLVSTRAERYGFQYFRIIGGGLKREADLTYTVEAVAYNQTYMNAFETIQVAPPPFQECSINSDCGPGFRCVNGMCVPVVAGGGGGGGGTGYRPGFEYVNYGDGVLKIKPYARNA